MHGIRSPLSICRLGDTLCERFERLTESVNRGNVRYMADNTPGRAAPVFPAQSAPLNVDCGHLPGETHDGACAYWRGVAAGDYPMPDAYPVDDLLQSIRRPIVQPAPQIDPALRGDR